MSAQMRKALDGVGGEPAGCGFENEAPEPDFSATQPMLLSPASKPLGSVLGPGNISTS